MSDNWEFIYAMNRASIDSHRNPVWYMIIEKTDGKEIKIIKSENDVKNATFLNTTKFIEVGYLPSAYFSNSENIPNYKRAVVSIYFINAEFVPIQQMIKEHQLTRQQIFYGKFSKNSEGYIIQKAVKNEEIGFIKYKEGICIAREPIHKTAKLSSNGKLTDIKSVSQLQQEHMQKDIINHFNSKTSVKQSLM